MFKSLVQFFVAAVFTVLLSSCGPSIKQFEGLKEPRITMLPAQKMLTVELKGTPAEVSGKAIGALYKVYFGLKGAHGMVAPRARWTPLLGGKQEMTGKFGLPVPDSITGFEPKTVNGIEVKLETWEYGQVAELLHVGAYNKEEPTVGRLHKFISDGGYKITGDHEEEYVKGPGMFFKGNPENYLTIIRYQVAKQK